MTPLYQDPCFTFRFAEDRLISRFHLESVPVGQRVSVFKIDPSTGKRQSLLQSATAGKNGCNLVASLTPRANGCSTQSE
jgi:hypothetical protein